MGNHYKNNPTSIAARRGELPPKQKPMGAKESKQLLMAMSKAILIEKTGIPGNFLKDYSDI